MDRERISFLTTGILKTIGEDVKREGLRETPMRVAKMYEELFYGYDPEQKPAITVFDNHRDGMACTGILRDHGYFFSFCEHHMLPFFGTFEFGYIPNKLVMGASKISRTVDYYAAKYQVAERLCYDVIQEIQEQVKPKGSILLMEARHLCKEMRGVKKVNSPYEVIEARGYFYDNEDGCKDEFMSRIRK